MCALEGAPAARGTASGMAAVAGSLLCHLKAGDHVVSARALFGSCRYIVEDLLPRYVTYLAAACPPVARCLWLLRTVPCSGPKMAKRLPLTSVRLRVGPKPRRFT